MSTKFDSRRPLRRSDPDPPRKSAPRAQQLSPQGASPAEEVASYVADMTLQLAAMAAGAKLDLLAYFLNMAHAESVAMAHNPTGAKAS